MYTRNITQHTYLKVHGEKEFADTVKFVTVVSIVTRYTNRRDLSRER